MNISKLVEMYAEDPAQFSDPQAFMARVNTKNITQTVRVHTQVVDEQRTISFAEMNGGPCTLRDLQEVQGVIRQNNLIPQVLDVIETVKREIMDGTITTKAQLKSRFQTLITAL